jgi:hypothetical protein
MLRLTAKNPAKESANRIHDDAVAREHGFSGGLVPGVTTYGYMLRPAMDAYGVAWLERGAASVRLISPVYEGEMLVVREQIETGGKRALSVEDESGAVRAAGSAWLPAQAPPPDGAALEHFPRRSLPSEQLEPARRALEGVDVLGALEFRFDADAEPPLEIDDDTPIYRAERVAHPVLLLGAANYALAANVALGPWIHTASEVCNHAAVRHGDFVSVRPRIARLFEKKGRELVELDVLYVVDEQKIALRVRHTAIYRL